MNSDTGTSHLDLSELASIAGRADREHPHLQTCELCREIAALMEGVRTTEAPAEALRSLEHRCIKELEISKLFEEESFRKSKEDLPALEALRHAAGCGPCGRRLKELAFVYSPAEDESVVEVVNQLKSSTPEWQRATAKRLSWEQRTSQLPSSGPSGGTSRRLPKSRWLWWAAAAAGVLIAVTAGLVWYRASDQRVERLLAQAYTNGRPFDFRLPDNGYAAVTQQMGSLSSFQNPSLMKANADIVDLSEADPRTKWLRGRAELLGRDPDAGILDHELDHRLLTRGRDLPRAQRNPAGMRKLDRIGEQVAEDLVEPRFVRKEFGLQVVVDI